MIEAEREIIVGIRWVDGQWLVAANVEDDREPSEESWPLRDALLGELQIRCLAVTGARSLPGGDDDFAAMDALRSILIECAAAIDAAMIQGRKAEQEQEQA